MRIIIDAPDRFGIRPEQMDRLHREIREVYPPQLHPRVQAAWQLEKAIYQAVIERGKNAGAVADQLDELTRLKREATDIRIQALNRFRAILEPEQYQAVMAASAEAIKPRP
jgi:predicted ATPase with chaperone activity